MVLDKMINADNQDFNSLIQSFKNATPFNHVVIDNFFHDETTDALVQDFPRYYDNEWHTTYNSPLESLKRTCNHWDRFPKRTYNVFNRLNSNAFLWSMKILCGIPVFADPGLHGGGWHIHASGGKLNIHKDYSIHPKLGLERRLNLIVYLTPDWQPEWGGGLELWSNDPETNKPLKCEKVVDNKFNRAIIFDTTQNSWHGLPKPISCPENVYRKSLAVYYLSNPGVGTDPRGRALFAPYGDQANDPAVLDLIEKRAK